jgi:hypothetical protein
MWRSSSRPDQDVTNTGRKKYLLLKLLIGCRVSVGNRNLKIKDRPMKLTPLIAGWFCCALFAQDGGQCTVVDRHRATSESLRQAASHGAFTEHVLARMGETRNFVPGGSRTGSQQALDKLGTIDKHIYGTLQASGVAPAEPASDYEFLRRVTLDLTGRIPTPERVQSYAADSRSNKREILVDELLAKPEWVDKWTMFYGDLFKNNARNAQINRYPDGVAAFQKWIQDSLRANKPYSQIATELIAASGTNSYENGQLNFLPGSFQPAVPQQDTYDQAAADVARTFLGLGNLNCILCHNGRGHLEALSVWGKSATRREAWAMASFFSRTAMVRVPVNPGVGTPYYWNISTDLRIRTDYALNTTTGNRPARQPIGTTTTIAPAYLFNGASPAPGADYREFLAAQIVADPLFSRAAVNYVWEHFFGLALVTPNDGFDPARLDADNPPANPGDLAPIQPTNAALLRDLAADFTAGGYDLKKLMRQIVLSQAYQMSSRYSGTWDPSYEPLYARHYVRRLWAEEVHDAVAQASGVLPSYDLSRTYPGTSRAEPWAMRAPETENTPDRGGAASRFLDAFLRGNRDDEDRRKDGSIAQALALMNDPFVLSRIRGSGNTNLLLQRNLSKSDDDLVTTLFLTVLSRPPSDAERTAALAQLRSGTRTAQAEDLLWSLFNKVDFVFNY